MSGKKEYEYRKVAFNKNVKIMILYATSPVKQIVGEVGVVGVIRHTPQTIWNLTKEFSGISKDEFDLYYQNKEYAIAYKLGGVKRYDKPKLLKYFNINKAPQSFIYLKE